VSYSKKYFSEQYKSEDFTCGESQEWEIDKKVTQEELDSFVKLKQFTFDTCKNFVESQIANRVAEINEKRRLASEAKEKEINEKREKEMIENFKKTEIENSIKKLKIVYRKPGANGSSGIYMDESINNK
jgi:hypothetical protein